MRFAYPVYLHVLWLIPIFFGVFLWVAKLRQQSLARFGEAPLVAKLSKTVSRRRQRVKMALFLLALLFLGIAIARPQISTQAVPVKAEGIDLIFALDTSASMLAEDIKPNRLERAKYEITALLDKLRGDRVGIVIFAGASFIQCPLTFDYSAVKLFLEAVTINSIAMPGTDLAGAVLTSSKALASSPAETSKVIILLTDGEGHTGDPVKAAEAAEKQGIKIYTIGIGSEKGELIPMRNEQGEVSGYKKDKAGNVILTKLDQLTLEKIAVLTDGQFYHVSSGGIELEKIYGDIANMAKTLRETTLVMHYEEQYQYFVGLALLLLLIDTFLTDRKTVQGVWEGRFK
jgi:Ca-activated chloride channel family protein